MAQGDYGQTVVTCVRGCRLTWAPVGEDMLAPDVRVRGGWNVTIEPQANDPRSEILEWIACANCDSEIPAHLGERWNDITPGQAREEWLRVYRSKRCRK